MMKIAVGSESVRSVTHASVSPEMSVHGRMGQENQRLEQTLFRDVPLNLELRRTSSEAQVQRSSAHRPATVASPLANVPHAMSIRASCTGQFFSVARLLRS